MARDSGPGLTLDARLVRRFYDRAGAARWGVSPSRFAEALEVSAGHAIGASSRGADRRARRELERYLDGLHLRDLALACACADGGEAAWEQFVRELRPVLYRAADALEPGGGAREVADSLYAELYGLQERHGVRRSLLAYFHGRSSLATWLRAMLSQRYVDRVRSRSRLDPLRELDDPPARPGPPDPDRTRYLALMQQALATALSRLRDRDRLRLSLYYAQQLTLAETGRVLHEHEATVSRQLARVRAAIRDDVERELAASGLSADEVADCFRSVSEDPGPLDLGALAAADGVVQGEGG